MSETDGNSDTGGLGHRAVATGAAIGRGREPVRPPELRQRAGGKTGSGTAPSVDQAFDLVIFDCDGVVVDSEVLSCRGLADMLTQYGLPTDLDEVYHRFLGRSSEAVTEYYRSRRGEPLPDAFQADYRRHLEVTFRASLKPMPHVAELLDRLDCAYCLASSSDPDRVRLTLSVTGMEPYFAGRIFSAASVSRTKPAPDLFLLAAREMEATPERTLVVEDSESGVAAGKAAGMTVWGFIGGSHLDDSGDAQRLTDAGADRIVRSMAEFPIP